MTIMEEVVVSLVTVDNILVVVMTVDFLSVSPLSLESSVSKPF